MRKKNLIRLQDITFGTIAVSSLFVLFGANGAFATTSVVDDVTVTVPAACTMSTTVNSNHTATVEVGSYVDDIGETTFKVTCNDAEGFSVYAIGYTNDEFGNTTMKPSILADTNAIVTGLATSGDTSNWAMKLTAVTGDYSPTIETGFNAYHVVPSEYTKVASYSSNTDSSSGSSFKSTYATFIASAQPADTYTGKVKYTVVHPSNTDAPAAPAMLDTGQNVNVKMKNLANNASNRSYNSYDSRIRSIQRSDTLPDDFVATDATTISVMSSSTPIYIFFDNTDDKGIMYYYAEGNAPITANPDCSYLLYYFGSLIDIAGLSDWDTAKVANMSYMFSRTKIASLDALATGKNDNPDIWNTSNVTDMSYMFYYCQSLADISGLSNWDTTKVTTMSYMFDWATKITNVDALATGKNGNPNIWNTGNVTDMNHMFALSTTLTDISGLSNWDTAKVTDMKFMLYDTKITNLDALVAGKNNNPNIWNTGNVTDMSYMFSGSTSTIPLADIAGISNWNTSKVTTLKAMFRYSSITNVNALATGKNNNPSVWNTGNVTDMSEMFKGASSLTDISGLANWDTAKVTTFNTMFQSAKITTLDALATGKNGNPNIWNTGNVTDMKDMFKYCSSIIDISGVSNWDTAKVTDMSSMFYNASSLADISPIVGWNVSKVTATAGGTTSSNNKFYQMFRFVPSAVTSGFVFTNRAGSIDSNGTYVVNT